VERVFADPAASGFKLLYGMARVGDPIYLQADLLSALQQPATTADNVAVTIRGEQTLSTARNSHN